MSEIRKILPVTVVFHPSWWNRHCGIRFDWNFFFNPKTRLESNLLMRRYLYERFPELGLGERDAEPRPMLGGTLLAAGFMISGMLGCDVQFYDDASPEVAPANFTDEQIEALDPVDILDSSLMKDLLRLVSELEAQFGYVEGDMNWEGVQNVALNLRGEQLLLDYLSNPGLAGRLLDYITEGITRFLDFMIARTGTTSLSVNRSISGIDPRIVLHSNCTLTMIAAEHYRDNLLKYDQILADRYQPFGIHYCGEDMHRFREEFARIEGISFFDVGWGSDVKLCRQSFPDKFLNLRLSPVRMVSGKPEEIAQDIEQLLADAGPLDKTGLCCVNLDAGTPDENIRTMYAVAEQWRRDHLS